MAHFRGAPMNIFGNLTRDPETFDTRNGEGVRFGVAANYRIYNSDKGEYVQEPNFFDCTAFGPIGQQILQQLRKGDFGWFEGHMQFRKYTRQDGTEGQSLSLSVTDAHTNLALVKRDNEDDDRDSSRDRGRSRDDERGRDRGRNRDDDQDDDRGRGRSRDDDRDDDRGRGRSDSRNDDRGRSGNRDRDDDRDDDRSRSGNRDRDDDRSRDNSRGRGNDDRYGNWSSPPATDDLPF